MNSTVPVTVPEKTENWPRHWDVKLDLLAGWLERVDREYEKMQEIKRYAPAAVAAYNDNYLQPLHSLYNEVAKEMSDGNYDPAEPEHEHDYRFYIRFVPKKFMEDALTGWYMFVGERVNAGQEGYTIEYLNGIGVLIDQELD